jgi:hypothetical protein
MSNFSDFTDNQTSNRQRDRGVYEYLLTLTDLVKPAKKARNTQNKKSRYSISSIASQWGIERMAVSRIMDCIYPEIPTDKHEPTLPRLDLDRLVTILSTLRNYWLEKSSAEPQNRGRRITRLEIVKAIRLFCQLSPAEQSKLALTTYPSKILLRQLEDNINDLRQELIPEVIAKLYQYFMSLKLECFDREDRNSNDKIFEKRIVEAEYRKALNLNNDENIDPEKFNHFHEKIKIESSKIEIESGFDRFDYLNRSQAVNLQENLNESSYLSKSAARILSKSVIENKILTNQLPIYLKFIEIKKNRALPLYLDDDGLNKNETGVLNHEYHEEELIQGTEKESMLRIKSLKNLFSYTVKVHFYLKLPKDYISDPKKRDRDLSVDRHPDGGMCVNFFEEVTGVGSPLSHVIAAINRVLLWDIPLLKEYIPIAKNIVIENKALGSSPNSTIWGHNVVCLCKREDYKATNSINEKNKKENYHLIFNTQEYATGDYCGFDLLEVVGKSAFYARLRAIKQTGINERDYMSQVLNRIREVNAFKKSENLLNFYPFSLLAMEEQIESSIFNGGKYRQTNKTQNNIEFIEPSDTRWSMVAYEAHLAIAEAYLKEGLYEVGKKYLNTLNDHITRHEFFIDSLIIAKYYLSMFRYEYLIDRNADSTNAKKMLKKSKEYLDRYINKCHAIDELPQVNFNSFFYILSRACAHEAKIHIFMNRRTDKETRKQELRHATCSFEKSRIYAAREGNASLYSMWSAYQSWCYIMSAYIDGIDKKQKTEYLGWANKLLDHALVCYSENGHKCYEAIKANAGKTKPELYGINDNEDDNVHIEPIPFIKEVDTVDDMGYDDGKENKQKVLALDMSVFTWKYPENFGQGYRENTYLFGMPSAVFLFVMGLKELCQDKVSKEKIKTAEQYFNYSWSIAEDGLEKKAPSTDDNQKKTKCFKRRFKDDNFNGIKEFSIGGLYPHRMTQFADFGKMFAIVCEIIIAKSNNIIDEKKLEYLKSKIKYLDDSMNGNNFRHHNVLTQEKYNIHLKEIYDQFRAYVDLDFKTINVNVQNINVVRDKIVSDIFQIITTRSIPDT